MINHNIIPEIHRRIVIKSIWEIYCVIRSQQFQRSQYPEINRKHSPWTQISPRLILQITLTTSNSFWPQTFTSLMARRISVHFGHWWSRAKFSQDCVVHKVQGLSLVYLKASSYNTAQVSGEILKKHERSHWSANCSCNACPATAARSCNKCHLACPGILFLGRPENVLSHEKHNSLVA